MYGDYEKALAGMTFGLDGDAKTAAAKAVIEFGEPVIQKIGAEPGAYALEKVRVVFSANFVTGNSIAASVLGTALAAVVFATDHATTFAALVAALDAVPGVTIAASNATTRTIDLVTEGQDTKLTIAVTGGAGQPTMAYTIPEDYVLAGVAPRIQKAMTSDALGARYEVTEALPVRTRGGIWVTVLDAVSAFKPAYITTSRKWTDEPTGNIATGYRFESTTTGAGLAQLIVK